MDTEKVTRVVLVDHRDERSRKWPLVYEQWDLSRVELSLQDDGRTLKVFVLK